MAEDIRISYTASVAGNGDDISVNGSYWGTLVSGIRNKYLCYVAFNPDMLRDEEYPQNTVGVYCTSGDLDLTVSQLYRLSKGAEVPF